MSIEEALRSQSTSSDSIDKNRPTKQPRIEIALETKSQWSKDGEKTAGINKAIMEMIAPFSIIDDVGFQRLVRILQPKFEFHYGRKYFTENLMPKIYNKVKCRVQKDLDKADAISFTFDVWSSRDSMHSLEQSRLKVYFKIKRVRLVEEALTEFSIPTEKIFLFLRDSAEVMIKVCNEMGLRHSDCFAHKLNLAKTQ
uniref:Transposase n=1 Tax=Meloidogyne javanica TaxID=6303 RepID=A0A915MV31_MELJA